MRSLRMGLVLVVLAAVSVAGCGGSGDDTTDSTAALTKSKFLALGNAICAKGNKTINAAAKKDFGGGQPSQADFKKFAQQAIIPAVQTQINGIGALPAPEGDQAQVDAILAAANQGVAKVKSDPGSLAAEGKQSPFAKANQLAKQYGLVACAG